MELKEKYAELEKEFGEKGAAILAGFQLDEQKNKALSGTGRYAENLEKFFKGRETAYAEYSEEQCALLKKLELFIISKGSAGNAGKALGVSPSILSGIRNCSYNGNTKEFFRNFESYSQLEAEKKKTVIYRDIEYAPTSISETIYQTLRSVHLKQNLCYEIDMLIMKDSVKSIDDLVNELKAKGYGINRGKYLAIKVKPNRKAIRSYRLGDGYALEHLEYRIEHKNLEMPLSEALKYSGIQREYALCIRQIQIQLYRRPEPERLHIATYREVERTSRLLFYLQEKQIHSAEDFQKAVAAADEQAEDLKTQKTELVQKISDTEKMIEEIPQYLEILNRRPLMPNDIKELSKFTHLKDVGVTSLDDAERLKDKIEEMKKSLVSLEEQLKTAITEKKAASDFYVTYENQMKSDYQILLEQAKAEML